ncbi:hypothetical protein MVEN_01263700 [Mycena venus]|uniref:Uncharacterized protein n=1 Tax=Mycena venus TaxID=2733690 RepID=A0A8H7CZC7_9AGAR|nr:hypothetical protein MVEN_01263700 [Mycena venus]
MGEVDDHLGLCVWLCVQALPAFRSLPEGLVAFPFSSSCIVSFIHIKYTKKFPSFLPPTPRERIVCAPTSLSPIPRILACHLNFQWPPHLPIRALPFFLDSARAVSVPSRRQSPTPLPPGGSFNVPRFASQLHSSVFPEEDDDQIVDMPAQTVFANHQAHRVPMTAAVDGPDNRFTHQQQRGMNPNVAPFTPSFLPHQPAQPAQPAQSSQPGNPAFQMQLMQMELMKMQAMQQYQQQQVQAHLLAQAQAQVLLLQQQQAQQSPRRASFNPPATAGPLSTSFDLRSATLRRAAQNNAADDQVPMTAALGGKFGSRPSSMSGIPMSRFAVEDYDDSPASLPSTPHTTTVISGGTSLGSPASNNVTANGTPSKSDSASTWRRGGNNNSVLSGNNRSPSVKVTPPPAERRVSPPPVASPTPAAGKARPQPLRFSVVASQPMPVVAVDNTAEGENDEAEAEVDSSSSDSSTPHSASSNGLSPREEASKKLYEGLGIGRPTSAVADQQQFAGHRMASQPMRQPPRAALQRGRAGAEELCHPDPAPGDRRPRGAHELARKARIRRGLLVPGIDI